jgi:polysaccharide export outer membrane protein
MVKKSLLIALLAVFLISPDIFVLCYSQEDEEMEGAQESQESQATQETQPIKNIQSVQETPAAQGIHGETDKDYIIAADNIIEINVYGELDLSATLRVSQDGTINYPLLGAMKAAGLSVRELEANITELLAEDYLVTPRVTIFIKEYGKISVLGAVNSPGAYEAKENLTLTKVIALAGGFTDTADASKVKVIRMVGNEKETIEVDVGQILEKSLEDVGIKPNDTIIVEEYGRISIMGQVNKPGVYGLKKSLTVVEAINLAGGFTPTAAQNGTRVIRVENGQKKIIPVPVLNIIKGGSSSKDILLQAGDTIVVPESFF